MSFAVYRARQEPHPPVAARRNRPSARIKWGIHAHRSRVGTAWIDGRANCVPASVSIPCSRNFLTGDVESLLAAVGYGIIHGRHQLLAKLLTSDELQTLPRREGACAVVPVR